MEKHICTHPENCVASKTNENINASKKTQTHGKNKDKHTQKENLAREIIQNTNAWQTTQELCENKMKKHIQKIGELAKHMKSRTHLENKE